MMRTISSRQLHQNERQPEHPVSGVIISLALLAGAIALHHALQPLALQLARLSIS